MKIHFLFVLIGVALSQILVGQSDSITPSETPIDYKNTVRWNLTPTLVLGSGSWAFGYERVLDNYQSFSTNVGFIQLPAFFSNTLDSLQIDRNSKRNGFSFAADYRFYIKKRNIHKAPDGLYWGPYFASYYFDTESNINIINNGNVAGDFIVESNLLFLMAGAELGYQFTLGKKRRWALDLIFIGPAIRYDIIKIKLGSQVSGEIDDDYLNGAYDLLMSMVPGLNELAEEGEINAKGFTSGFGAGYRYVVQIGYRF